uniref:Uncharacterized protein n=1 Tax=Physcomitrium patens TaxID=3218 RepID=A0A2K1L967_PHYPA|nr:hypothetical protein PHYPA_000999 [Physcomitrium patens]
MRNCNRPRIACSNECLGCKQCCTRLSSSPDQASATRRIPLLPVTRDLHRNGETSCSAKDTEDSLQCVVDMCT